MNLKKQTKLVQQLLEEKATHFEAVLNEKEKYIDILRDKMSSTSNHNTFNIIRNNIHHETITVSKHILY